MQLESIGFNLFLAATTVHLIVIYLFPHTRVEFFKQLSRAYGTFMAHVYLTQLFYVMKWTLGKDNGLDLRTASLTWTPGDKDKNQDPHLNIGLDFEQMSGTVAPEDLEKK